MSVLHKPYLYGFESTTSELIWSIFWRPPDAAPSCLALDNSASNSFILACSSSILLMMTVVVFLLKPLLRWQRLIVTQWRIQQKYGMNWDTPPNFAMNRKWVWQLAWHAHSCQREVLMGFEPKSNFVSVNLRWYHSIIRSKQQQQRRKIKKIYFDREKNRFLNIYWAIEPEQTLTWHFWCSSRGRTPPRLACLKLLEHS